MSETKTKKWGLVLDLPGAPSTPHVVAGLEGEFTSSTPRPLADCAFSPDAEHGVRPVSLEDARRLDKDEGCPLKLVPLKD